LGRVAGHAPYSRGRGRELVGLELAWPVQEAGYAVVGPERSVAEALEALRTMTVDLALLDMALAARRCSRCGRRWRAWASPSFSSPAIRPCYPRGYSARPLVPKPWERTALLSLIPQVLGWAARRAR
jgi:hypothetical protein